MATDWKVKVYKDVLKKQLPLLKATGLICDYEDIIGILKKNPYENIRSREKFSLRNKQIFSMRINSKHRVVYTIEKEKHLVNVWSAWSHYEKECRSNPLKCDNLKFLIKRQSMQLINKKHQEIKKKLILN
ncbi:Txe/YoeB family addiction module toxin [Enterococcus sp. AN402]|uniref:Txe/YoeB family addiction module toxin n=1 Tax=Enterococcus sp. AN402 TaxID=3151386 RepID=UPI00345B24BE